MKRLSIIVLALTLAAGAASAQKVIVGGRLGYSHPYYSHPYYARPYYGFGLGLGFGYPYYGYPYYYNRPYYRRATGLERELTDIQNDYADRIQSARMDDSLTGRERRRKIRTLREQRREAIDNARRNYYKQPYPYRGYNDGHNYNQNNSSNNNDQNNNSSSK